MDGRQVLTKINGLQFNFLTYTATNIQTNITINTGSLGNNSSYSNSTNSIPVTVTSLYNHTDYRSNATINLTTANYDDFTIYKDFQMNHVKINASGYKSNSGRYNL